MKRQRTRWTFWRIGGKHKGEITFVRCGIVRNIDTKKHQPFDVVRLQYKSRTDEGDIWMTPDEAANWACGLTNALDWWFNEFKPYDKWRRKRVKLEEKKEK